mgnify:FL=1
MTASVFPNARLSSAKMALSVVTLGILVVIGREFGGYLPRFLLWVDTLGVWAPVTFVLAYVAATLTFVPGSLLTMTAGAVFGLVEGTFYTFVGATIGSALAFLTARYLARDAIQRRLLRYPKFAAIDKAVGLEGFKIVLLLRLSPVFPFNFLNYALGLTTVTFRAYLLGAIGMLPGSAVYAYYGMLAGDVFALAGGVPSNSGVSYYVTMVLGLVATVLVTMVIIQAARRALRNTMNA